MRFIGEYHPLEIRTYLVLRLLASNRRRRWTIGMIEIEYMRYFGKRFLWKSEQHDIRRILDALGSFLEITVCEGTGEPRYKVNRHAATGVS